MRHMLVSRRGFLAAVPLAAAPTDGVRHLLPGASHDRFLIKASFYQTPRSAPVLRVGNRAVDGTRTSSDGRFWLFDVNGLRAGTAHTLRITAGSKTVHGPWTLRTMPPPDAAVERFRLLIYTCAGGHDAMKIEGTDTPYWVPVEDRRAMFAAALAEKPDAMIAIGDHVYWDLRYGRGTGRLPIGQQPWARAIVGSDFERDLPVIGTANELRLTRAADRQIAELYGTMFESTPVHFIQDDHDYFENDEATADWISFPPDDFMTRMARVTQRLYFPEHLPSSTRPAGLPGTDGLSECFGTLRAGTLVEMLLYDCRRFQTLRGPHATLVPENVEAWITRRMRESDAAHVVNVPSMPIGWSAGKWGEWYPDVLDDRGRLGVAKAKYFWPEGWRRQHDRLLRAASGSPKIPLFLSGDLHALAHGAIERNGAEDLRRNPVHTVLTGPVSTGPRGWPSAARGTPPLVATGIEMAEDLRPLEKNGFTMIDFTRGGIDVRMFRGAAEFHRFRIERAL